MAHACVASLMRTIESLLTSNSPMQSLIYDHREELCALCEKVSSLEVVANNFEKNNVLGEMAELEVEVKEVASAVEHTIQLRVTEVLENDEKSIKIQDKGKQASKESTVQEFPSSPKDILNVENCMVGRDDQRKRLVEDLTRSKSVEPKVIPIIGMGGIANMLKKSLMGKRYLIVLDDMWKTEAWDAVKLCFPSGNKGSVILLTTRITEVARDAGTKNLSLKTIEELPSDLKTIGKQIAEKCHGLPLTIAVVAGLLKSKRAIADWENVAKDVKPFVTNDPDKQCSRVLGLSYNHLTSGLKTCLLHFGFFPEDSEIPTKKLMRSWMAEGFLKLENDLE
ncbi:hypothetical protein CQW23_06769 [Capsicum baccatum]|uniref:NB-ARC domain-containing protein n=1 Tax=Capsicum baccatum TaxID=33114 RepID=A0A2G2X4B0_CAPBA|nr:hypothetical protein CQW23_06769 [Capsicum baccatum]